LSDEQLSLGVAIKGVQRTQPVVIVVV
jgi:hypothetical protein